jgi:hypothetical protein
MPDRQPPKGSHYTVGYGQPPKASQFAPGKSGNPKGRPKGSRPVGALLHEIIHKKIAVTDNGRTRRVSTLEVMLRRLVNDAMRGDGRALKLLLSLIDRYGASNEATVNLAAMQAEDREILAQYLPSACDFASDLAPAREERERGDAE